MAVAGIVGRRNGRQRWKSDRERQKSRYQGIQQSNVECRNNPSKINENLNAGIEIK